MRGLVDGHQLEDGLRCVCEPLRVTCLVCSRMGALDVDPLCALVSRRAARSRAPCHADCGPAATQQGTSVLTEESACSNALCVLNCTCTRVVAERAEHAVWRGGCHADTMDWTSVGDPAPHANAFACSARSCSARRIEEDGTPDSRRGPAARGRSATGQLLQRSWPLRLQRGAAGAAAAACSATAAANCCCCSAGSMDARPGCRAPLICLAGATDEAAWLDRTDGHGRHGHPSIPNSNWATRDG